MRGRGGTLSGLRALLMFAAAWRVLNRALILCQTLCRLRGRCARPARALPFGTPWGGARGLVGRLGRVPSRYRTGGLYCVESSLNEAPLALVRALRTHNAIQGVILGPVERLYREPVLGPSHQAELITANLFHSQAQRCRRAQTCKASERAFFTVITAPCEGDCITCSHRDNSCIH